MQPSSNKRHKFDHRQDSAGARNFHPDYVGASVELTGALEVVPSSASWISDGSDVDEHGVHSRASSFAARRTRSKGSPAIIYCVNSNHTHALVRLFHTKTPLPSGSDSSDTWVNSVIH